MTDIKIVEIAYLAGIIDGEGTITILRRNKLLDTPVVQVPSCDLLLLEWIKARWGGCISKKKVYKEHHNQSWSWEVRSANAVRLLESVLPFLLIPRKRARAQILVNEYFTLTPRNGRYPDGQRECRREMLARVMEA